VATVYGVGSANLLFLPAAAKIKARIHAGRQRKELIVEAVGGIVEGLNPKLLRLKLEAYAHSSGSKKKPKEKPGAAPDTAPAKMPAKSEA
jgi:chemotaxis protein MotA